MPTFAPTDDHARIWHALCMQADRFTASRSWPKAPGCETWAYTAADRVATMAATDSRLLRLPFRERLAAASAIHYKLAWQTARGRASRCRRRYLPLDQLATADTPIHRDIYRPLALMEADLVCAIEDLGVSPAVARAVGARICRGMTWQEIAVELRRLGFGAVEPGALRVHYSRMLRRHGRMLAESLGIDSHGSVAKRRPRGV